MLRAAKELVRWLWGCRQRAATSEPMDFDVVVEDVVIEDVAAEAAEDVAAEAAEAGASGEAKVSGESDVGPPPPRLFVPRRVIVFGEYEAVEDWPRLRAPGEREAPQLRRRFR